MGISYKESGVDIEKGDLFVERISKLVKSTYNQDVHSGIGGFCALYANGTDRFLAASTDGVGTKIKLAIDLNIHHTIGIDLVAMCVNDLICSGARPLFFLDYFASSHLELAVSEKVIEGIVEGCKQSSMALIGGETAEMPGMYQKGDYDLAGFSIGEVHRNDLIDGKSLKDNDVLIGIPSTGFHSNGYSLVRKLIEKNNLDENFKKQLLTPTRIYVKTIMSLLQSPLKKHILGIANITGSGFLNIPRINSAFDYFVKPAPVLPPGMSQLCELSGLDGLELHRTFNMGVGMAVATNAPESVMEYLKNQGEAPFILGEVKKGTGKIFLGGQDLEGP